VCSSDLMSKAVQAANLYRELIRDYPQLSATREAAGRLEKLGVAAQ